MTCLAVQALHDGLLKTGLTGSLLLRNRNASVAIQAFLSNPLKFSNTHVISGDTLSRMRYLPAHARAQFISTGSNNYDIELVYSPSSQNNRLSVNAYFLGGYNANQSAKEPAYVDIPINATENSFLFTGSLIGGSVVVTKLNETTYRVYHDSRVNSSLLYDNVVMAFDSYDYQKLNSNEGRGTAYMYFKDGKWQLILQRQEYEIINGIPTPILCANEEPVSILHAALQRAVNHQQTFLSYREKVHQKLIQLAFYFGIEVNNIGDGTYIDGEFSLSHSAISPWLNLKDKINQHYQEKTRYIQEYIENSEIELNSLIRQQNRNEETEIKINELTFIIESKKKVIEYYREIYFSVLTEVVSVESSWLWLQIKNKYGFSSVVQNREEIVGHGIPNIDINRRYDIMVHEHLISSNNEFNQGIEQYETISIQEINSDMSSQELKLFYLNCDLNMKMRGALYQKIEDKIAIERDANILRLTSKFSSLFQYQGSIYSRLAPQDFYLPLMGDNSGGRCYPLVRAMAVALSKNDLNGANTLLDKMFLAAASPTADSSILLKKALKNLHSNTYATRSSESLGLFCLSEIKSDLISGGAVKMYAINTPTHAMLIGKALHDVNPSYYYFYDPNFGIFTFDNVDKLFSALDEFMVKNKMATTYCALGSESKPIFELITINTTEMANVPVGAGLNVADLSNENQLDGLITRRRYVDNFIENKKNIMGDLQIRASLNILKAQQWADRISCAYSKIKKENQLNEKWLSNFSNIETLDKNRYRIQFINQSDAFSSCWIETSDSTFIEFKEYFNENMRVFQNSHSFNNAELQRKENINDAEYADGMNAGMFFFTLFQNIEDDRSEVSGNVSSNLSSALKIHSYVTYATITHGMVNDSARVSQLVHTLWKESFEVEKVTFVNFSSSLVEIGHGGVGKVFQGTTIGLDIYELANAQNEAQESIFGTQLAFDSLAIFEYSATLAGAESVLEIVEPLIEPILGLGIGIIELVKINALHAEEAAQVGVYFYHLRGGYIDAKIAYDPEKKLILPTDYIVYKKIDFRHGYFKLDSQYIYRSRDGLKGSGDGDYINIFGPNPRSEVNKDEAINIREAIGSNMRIIGFDPSRTDTMVLPIVPKSYIDYEYGDLAFSTQRNDLGFDILRRIESQYRFDFDFFHGVNHKIITKLKHEYVYTSIQIILDEKNRHLVVPNIPEPWKGKLLHVVKGYGGEYRININFGASLALLDDTNRTKISKWIIDASFVNGTEIQLHNNRIEINGVNVYINDLKNRANILIVNKKNDVYQVNLVEKKVSIIAIDASQWGDEIALEEHLISIKNNLYLNSDFIIINNYSYEGINVGRAYYYVANNRVIFTHSSNEVYHSAILGAFDEQYAYFFSPNTSMVWRVSTYNGNINATYENYIVMGPLSKVLNLWQENGSIFIKMHYNKDALEIISMYKIIGHELEIISISGNAPLLDKIALTSTLDVDDGILSIYALLGRERSSLLPTSGISYNTPVRNAELITIDGKDSEGMNRRYWLRTDSNTLIKPNLEASFNTYIDHDGVTIKWSSPDDLVLVGNLFDSMGIEVFFFYSPSEDKIYRQEGLGQDILDNNIPTAKIIQGLTEIQNVTLLHGKIIIVNKKGEIKQLNIDGSIQLVGVNDKWLDTRKGNSFWWSNLDEDYKNIESMITLVGLKNGNDKVPGWYFKGKFIIAHSLPSSHKLEFLDFNTENKGAYIFDITVGKLFYQEATSIASITQSMGNPPSNIQTEQYLPNIIPVYENIQFKNVKIIDGGLIMVTINNEIIYHSLSGDDDEKFGTCLMINGTQNDDTIIPTKIAGVKHLILSGGDGRDVYKIKYDDWIKYNTIIIDNFSGDKQEDEIILPIKNSFDDLMFEKNGNDIVISDIANETLVILREVFGSKAEAYRHFKMKIEDYSFYLDVETIISCLDGQELPISFYIISDEHISRNIRLHLDSSQNPDLSLDQNPDSSLDQNSDLSLDQNSDLIRSRNTNLLREQMNQIYGEKSISIPIQGSSIREKQIKLITLNMHDS